MYQKTRKKIQQLIEKDVFPGAAFSFITEDTSQDYSLGNAQIDPVIEPLECSMLFDVASLTKVICTTTVVLQLVEAGMITLDLPIKTYLTEFQDEKLTTRHLLTHTGDIQSYIENRDNLTKEELRKAYLQVQSGSNLGKKVAYTDTGTILLGFVLEKLLGKDAIAIFKERVLLPLDMKDSTFLPSNDEKIVPTERHPIRGLIRGQTHDPKAFILAEHAGNAGLFANLSDLKKFVFMYLNDGSYQLKQVLKKETIQSLLVDQTPDKTGQRSLGWDLKYDLDHSPILFHTGYTGTFLVIDVLAKEAFIFLSNRVHPIDKKAEYIQKRDELILIYLKEKKRKDESLSF